MGEAVDQGMGPPSRQTLESLKLGVCSWFWRNSCTQRQEDVLKRALFLMKMAPGANFRTIIQRHPKASEASLARAPIKSSA